MAGKLPGMPADERGLTLIEVLAAVTILAIISVTIISYFIAAMERSADESRRIIATNLARMKAAELRQTVRPMTAYGAVATKTGETPLPESIPLEPTVVNGTTYRYAVTLNPAGAAARTNALDGLMSGKYEQYLVPMTVRVSWDGDNPRKAKSTFVDSYLVKGRS
ncbi:prepilin-type N-terminal cleavage/methylation domain-containing protein [Paenibacillaceae bacterium WGS1546]|uniref:type IV pilus modification PilV family protein n=1 Tax=Cohnella sp. WGS1546 TaxID=3366810 RepID=UPI00372D73A4